MTDFNEEDLAGALGCDEETKTAVGQENVLRKSIYDPDDAYMPIKALN